MASTADVQRCIDLLTRLRLGEARDVRAVSALAGGVSSDIFHVSLAGRELCVKFPCERLRVEADWRSSSLRSRLEYDWLYFANANFPGSSPALLGFDAASRGFAMAYLPPERFPNWKAELMGGVVDVAFAARLGGLLAKLHALSAAGAGEIAPRFPGTFFHELRIAPFLETPAARFPEAAQALTAMARDLGEARIALMHGDVSPKNILKGPDGPVLLDAECAAFGDPAFDLAFCTTHLVAKAIHLLGARGALLSAAAGLDAAYRAGVDWEAPDTLAARAAAMTAALMLARVAGKSPLDYLRGEEADRLRDLALELLARPAASVAALLDRVAECADD